MGGGWTKSLFCRCCYGVPSQVQSWDRQVLNLVFWVLKKSLCRVTVALSNHFQINIITFNQRCLPVSLNWMFCMFFFMFFVDHNLYPVSVCWSVTNKLTSPSWMWLAALQLIQNISIATKMRSWLATLWLLTVFLTFGLGEDIRLCQVKRLKSKWSRESLGFICIFNLCIKKPEWKCKKIVSKYRKKACMFSWGRKVDISLKAQCDKVT